MELASMTSALIAPSYWRLDPSLTFLNHGSFGACPIEILDAQSKVRNEMERSPVRFNLLRLPALYEEARTSVAPLLGLSPEEVLFVSNASEGISIALRSIDWQSGDEVIISQDSYPACRHMLTELSRREGLVIKVAMTPFGGERWAEEVIEAFTEQVSEKTKLVLIDHITSPTALVYPVKALIALADKIGAFSLVDGAHAPGQLNLEIQELRPSFYVGNAHKWLMCPKSCAVLYVSPNLRQRTNPLVISHGYLAKGEGRSRALFDWMGTRDYSAMAVLPYTVKWINQRCGDFASLRAHNNKLCREARALLIDLLWSGHSVPSLPPESALAHMAAIPVPPHLSERFISDPSVNSPPSSSASAGRVHPLQRALWSEGYEIPVIPSAHGLMIRLSAQAYNDLEQYLRLANTLSHLERR